ncbi:hypothetical protein DNU06_11065 [Putridiphycobacter roseus]|uniref:Uncharacterized protein n=1 Tax=Putridiphycobacter roseus TaxID=2219161 RepID=A0A2W1MXB8_9FLAO|nr:hypothetical protein [Putridiphycobacter roseus]PZE16789.1 hypothetical protein DNU06_11065 [Putridiphycobacter roseus]
MEIFVFKTSVRTVNEVQFLTPKLNGALTQKCEWNFDLEDCDGILRVESPFMCSLTVQKIVTANGFICQELY